MFLGFYKNEEATRDDLRDGWMHTGDAGYFKKENGHLVVIDRIKDLAVTSTGTRFSPQFIENKLKFSPFIAEAVILGHGRPYLAAIVCIRYSIVVEVGRAAQHRLHQLHQPFVAPGGLPAVAGQRSRRSTRRCPRPQRIRKFVLLYKELDADDGELTRTRKVRRSVINEKYADIIDAIYSDTPMVHVDTVIRFQDGITSRDPDRPGGRQAARDAAPHSAPRRRPARREPGRQPVGVKDDEHDTADPAGSSTASSSARSTASSRCASC